MNSLQNLCDMIDNKPINEKKDLIIEMNQKIESDKNALNNMMENINNIDSNFIIPAIYLNLSIDELEVLFNNTSDIMEQIIIYHTMTIMVNKHKNELNHCN